MERLKNKNILITGGTRGIGLASAQEFEREGARVAICGTDEKTLKEARSTLGPKALAFSADVSKLSDLDGLYSKLKGSIFHDSKGNSPFEKRLFGDHQFVSDS